MYIVKECDQDKAYYDFPHPAYAGTFDQNKTCELKKMTYRIMSQGQNVRKKTPYLAGHKMEGFLIEKTRNVAAVKRQLAYNNAAYSLQYSRITQDGLQKTLNERE